MNKLLIGAIVVLITLALIPTKSETFSFENLDQVPATIVDKTETDTEEIQTPLIHSAQSNPVDNSVIALAENMESDNSVVEVEQEQEQEIEYNDRSIFISIGAILLFGILLLLPLHLQRL